VTVKGVGCPDRELFPYCSPAPRKLGSAKGCLGIDLPPPPLIMYRARQKLALQPFLKRNGSELKRLLLSQDQTGAAGLIYVVEIALQRAVRPAEVIQIRHQLTPWASIDASGRIDTSTGYYIHTRTLKNQLPFPVHVPGVLDQNRPGRVFLRPTVSGDVPSLSLDDGKKRIGPPDHRTRLLEVATSSSPGRSAGADRG